MTQLTKPLLAPVLRERLLREYGNLVQAASGLDTSYDRLKKCLQRNRFSDTDLKMLFPEKSRWELGQLYTFSTARRNGESKERILTSSVLLVSGLDEADLLLIRENKAVAEKITRMIREECTRIRQIL